MKRWMFAVVFVLIILTLFYSPIKSTLGDFSSSTKITGRVLEGLCSDYSSDNCPRPECATITRAVQGCTGVTNTEVCVPVEEACEELGKTGVCFTPLCKLEKKILKKGFPGCESEEEIEQCVPNLAEINKECLLQNDQLAVRPSGGELKVPANFVYEEVPTKNWNFFVGMDSAGIKVTNIIEGKIGEQGSNNFYESSLSTDNCKYYAFNYLRNNPTLIYNIPLKSEDVNSEGRKSCIYSLTDEIIKTLELIPGKAIQDLNQVCPDLQRGRKLQDGIAECPSQAECRIQISPGSTAVYGYTFEKDDCGNVKVVPDNSGNSIGDWNVDSLNSDVRIDEISKNFIDKCMQNYGEKSCIRGTEIEENNNFESANNNDLNRCLDSSVINGAIGSMEDIDVFSLGKFLQGERVTADVNGSNGLNTVAAIFDQNGDLIDANDDRNYYAEQLNPYVTNALKTPTDNLYAAIAITRGSTFSLPQGRNPGSYRISVKKGDLPEIIKGPERQIVWLDFAGGDNVQIATQPFELMRAFSAESISPRLAGQTEHMIDIIIQRMNEDFLPYNVVFYNSREHQEPTEPHTSVFFGNYNQAYLGLSDNVDTGNSYLVQESIIYTEDFRLFESMQASADEVAQAIANTGAHELGHLLGLEHTDDPVDLMATAASARQILETNADFRRAPLDRAVFPLGWQNEPKTLMQNVGARQ